MPHRLRCGVLGVGRIGRIHATNLAGRVAGARLTDGRAFRARRGVVVATGGYEWNAELMKDFEAIPRLRPQSPCTLTGDGLIFSAEIGAAIRRTQNNLNLMLGFTLPPASPGGEPVHCMAGITELCSPHTMVVNAAGKRFGDAAAPPLRARSGVPLSPLRKPPAHAGTP